MRRLTKAPGDGPELWVFTALRVAGRQGNESAEGTSTDGEERRHKRVKRFIPIARDNHIPSGSATST